MGHKPVIDACDRLGGLEMELRSIIVFESVGFALL
jgi:hypothetical protein